MKSEKNKNKIIKNKKEQLNHIKITQSQEKQ